jgi:hypothetical protein
MAEDKKQQANEASRQPTEEHIHGRIYNSQNPEWEQQDVQHDISGIDQQEGNMEHGEKGANFTERKEES